MRQIDEDEASKLNADPWQVELLKVNPDYVHWGPGEDYMSTDGDGLGSSERYDTWSDFGPWGVDDLNECVHFYFSLHRENLDCAACDGSGYHPKSHTVVNSFYEHQCESNGMPASAAWHDKITDDEAAVLVAAGRAKEGSTAESINAENGPGRRGFMGHDAINRMNLIEARLNRLGIPVICDACAGSGYVYTTDACHVSLTLWWLHPRKGCSRGIEIKRIERGELPAVQALLRAAAERNAERFGRIGAICGQRGPVGEPEAKEQP